jgi:hypothetical protein
MMDELFKKWGPIAFLILFFGAVGLALWSFFGKYFVKGATALNPIVVTTTTGQSNATVPPPTKSGPSANGVYSYEGVAAVFQKADSGTDQILGLYVWGQYINGYFVPFSDTQSVTLAIEDEYGITANVQTGAIT